MKAWIGAGLVAALAVLFTAPGATAAAPGWHEKPRNLHLSFHAKTDNGFLMALQTAGHRQVNLSLSKGNVLVDYRTTGRVSRNGIEAKFGELGEIAVEFSGRPTPFRTLPGIPRFLLPRIECRGRRPQQETGTFQGTIRFDGEGGFTRIDADRAKGTMRRTYRRLCKGRAGSGAFGLLLERASAAAKDDPKPGDLSFDVLIAVGHQAGRSVVFETIGITGSSGDPLVDEIVKSIGPLAVAGTVERRDDMRIKRVALAGGGEGSLIISPSKRKRVTATVAFPKPFEGTAEFEHAPGTPPTWLGTLAARLPGIGPVPLTGEGFETVFCRLALGDGIAELKNDPCFKEAEELRRETASTSLLAG